MLARIPACNIDRVVLQNVITCPHQIIEGLARLAGRQIGTDALADDVVRACKIIGFVAVLPKQAVPIGYAGVEMAHGIAELGFKRANQFVRLGGRDLVGAVIDHDLVIVVAVLAECDHVAAVSRLSRLHGQAHAHGFKR